MKHFKKLLGMFILGVMILVPLSNTYAATTVKEGVYFAGTKEFYKLEELNHLQESKITSLFLDNDFSEIYIYIPGIGIAILDQTFELDLVEAAIKNGNEDTPEKLIPNGKYKDKNGSVVTVEGDDTGVDESFQVLSIE